ncbi:hypothetical protein LIER_07858 [Lithospermum erythrorhizon]|uniref:Transposase (putative) gypsy type domain-containing protein n=1 Tax=Lithospermum erythrorhizon TaxID=34254 RepID=A0AAV3P9T3_LITER
MDMRLPRKGDQVYEPVLDPSATEGPHFPGWTSLYIESMSYGLPFPFSRFVNRLLIAVNRAPGQISPVGWLTINTFIVACRIAEIKPTLRLFFNMYSTSHTGILTSFTAAKGCNIFIKKKPGKIDEGRWHKKWCYICEGMNEAVPKFRGVLIHAGMICSKELDPLADPPVTWGIAFRGLGLSGTKIKYLFDHDAKASSAFQKSRREHQNLHRHHSSFLHHYHFWNYNSYYVSDPSECLYIYSWEAFLQLLLNLHLALGRRHAPRGLLKQRLCLVRGTNSPSAPNIAENYLIPYLELQYTLPCGFTVDAKAKQWGAADCFRATRPLLIEEIEKDYEVLLGLLAVHGATMKHMVEAMNVSYVLACQLHNLRADGEGSRERERSQLAKIQELEKENEKLLRMHAEAQGEKKATSERNAQSLKKLAEEAEAAKDGKLRQALEEFRHSDIYRASAGEDSAYYLCRFAKTYKDSNPQIVANYEEFISEYPPEWFTNIDIHAHLSSMEEGEDEAEPEV